jgi:hypothetical protein
MGKRKKKGKPKSKLRQILPFIMPVMFVLVCTIALNRWNAKNKEAYAQAKPFQSCEMIVEKKFDVHVDEYSSAVRNFLHFDVEGQKCRMGVSLKEYAQYNIGDKYILKGRKSADKCWAEHVLEQCQYKNFNLPK